MKKEKEELILPLKVEFENNKIRKEINQNIMVLKPFFRKICIIRGYENKNNYEISNETNFINILENKKNFDLILPTNEYDSKQNNEIELKEFNLKFDNIISLHSNRCLDVDFICKENIENIFLNQEILNLINGYWGKLVNYSTSDHKNYLGIYLSDPIEYSTKICMNKNLIIILENFIKNNLFSTNIDVFVSLITKDSFIPYIQVKNINKNSETKSFLNILEFCGKENLNNFENENYIFDEMNYNYSTKFKEYVEKFYFFNKENKNLKNEKNNINGIYFKIILKKNKSEIKFLYLNINKSKMINNIINKINGNSASIKKLKKDKTSKNLELKNQKDLISYDYIYDEIDFNENKFFSCFLDLKIIINNSYYKSDKFNTTNSILKTPKLNRNGVILNNISKNKSNDSKIEKGNNKSFTNLNKNIFSQNENNKKNYILSNNKTNLNQNKSRENSYNKNLEKSILDNTIIPKKSASFNRKLTPENTRKKEENIMKDINNIKIIKEINFNNVKALNEEMLKNDNKENEEIKILNSKFKNLNHNNLFELNFDYSKFKEIAHNFNII